MATSSRPDPASLFSLHEEDFPGLREAFTAFRSREWPRLIGICLQVVGVDKVFTATQQTPTGIDNQLWAFSRNSAAIVVTLDRKTQMLAVDSPLTDVARDTETALLHTALRACGELFAARPARRGNRLLLTATAPITALPPPRLIHLIDEVAAGADFLDNHLAAEFGVRMLGPQMRKGHVVDVSLVGTPRRLANLSAADRPDAHRVQPRARAATASSSLPSSSAASLPPAGFGSGGGGLGGLLDVVREAQQASIGLGFQKIDDALEAWVHLAFAHRAALAGGLDLDASRLLLRAAIDVRNQRAPAASMRGLYGRLLQERGVVAPEGPLRPMVIARSDVKKALSAWVGAAASTPNTVLRRALLLGGLSALVLFADVPELRDRLRSLHDGSLGTDSASVDQLYATLTGMCR